MTMIGEQRAPSAPSSSKTGANVDGHVWRRRALLFALFLGLTALMLRPTGYSLDHTVPDLGDPVLYIWGLSWGGHAILTQPLHLFSANIFWPHPLTFAYTDNLLNLAAPFGLVRLLGGSWALALNLTMIGLLVLSQAATYLLAHWLTGRRDAAVLAAIAFTFSSFLYVHLGHTQLLELGLFPLCFYLLFRLLEERRLRWAVLLGVANVAMLTGALYYAAIYAVCVVVMVGGWLVLHRRDLSRRLVHGFLVVGAITLLAVPTLVPYAQLDQQRTIGPKSGLRITDLIGVSPGSVLYPGLDHAAAKRGGRVEHTYFPGFSTALLALIGVAALAAARRRDRRARRSPPARPRACRRGRPTCSPRAGQPGPSRTAAVRVAPRRRGGRLVRARARPGSAGRHDAVPVVPRLPPRVQEHPGHPSPRDARDADGRGARQHRVLLVDAPGPGQDGDRPRHPRRRVHAP